MHCLAVTQKRLAQGNWQLRDKQRQKADPMAVPSDGPRSASTRRRWAGKHQETPQGTTAGSTGWASQGTAVCASCISTFSLPSSSSSSSTCARRPYPKKCM